MIRKLLTLTLLAAAVNGCGLPRAQAGGSDPGIIPVSIYGEDDRRDYYAVDAVMRTFAESTVALFSDTAVSKDMVSGTYRLDGRTLKDKFNLRDSETFGEQPVGAFCSGVLVGADLVLSAGHCFKPDPRGGSCARVKLVFGYAVSRAGEMPISFPEANVYSCKEILVQRVQDKEMNFSCRGETCSSAPVTVDGPDYALIRLDRKAAGRLPLAINRGAFLDTLAPLAVIGYPSGLPVKVAAGGSVRSVSANGYFTAELDAFEGNSGSPVFNTRTLKIEGILARGGADYVYGPGAAAVADPRDPYAYAPGTASAFSRAEGRGEDVTLIREVGFLIPETGMEKVLDEALLLKGQRDRSLVKPVPAIYAPGADSGPRTLPAVYYGPAPSAPVPVAI